MAAVPLADDGFQAFTPEHGLILALLVSGAVALGYVGRRQRATADPVRFRRGFAVLIPVFTLPFQLLQLLPGDFTMGTSLPLQVCDLSWMVAVWALWTRDARAVALLYFWGLTLDVQAAITPSLGQTFPDPRYFMFWGMHLLTFWATVYVVCLAGGPTWRGYRFALACTAVWAAAVMGFNALADTNYGYLAEKPDTASLLDLLGPWPLYVAAEVGILAAVWAAMTWPWVRAGAARSGRQSAGDRSSEHGRRRPVPPGFSGGASPPAAAHQHASGDERADPGGDQES
jgi:hypothetical integral membrane protein (TIGR02206 family)